MGGVLDSLPPRRAVIGVWGQQVRITLIAAVIGGIFGVGLFVGKNFQSRTGVEGTSPSTLAEITEQTDKLEKVEADLKLRFHESLVGKPSEKDVLNPGFVKPKKEIKSTPKPAVETPKVAEAPAPVEPEKPEEVAEEFAEELVEVIPEKDLEDRDRLNDALKRVLGDEAVEIPQGDAEETPKAVPEVLLPYTVQVAATPNRDGAEALAKKLRSAGFKARVLAVKGETGETVYRVRGAVLKTREAADALRAELSAKEISGMVLIER